MARKTDTLKQMRFEQALTQLEKIVSDMESAELSLDDSLEKYQQGIELIKVCAKKLEEAEKKIEVLVKDEGGKLKKIPLDAIEKKDSMGV